MSIEYCQEALVTRLGAAFYAQRSAAERQEDMMDLVNIAQRLDAEEKLKLKYKCLVRVSGAEQCTQTVRMDRLLDVEPEHNTLFVSFDDRDVIWVRSEEAIEVIPDDGVYGETASK